MAASLFFPAEKITSHAKLPHGIRRHKEEMIVDTIFCQTDLSHLTDKGVFRYEGNWNRAPHR